MSKVIYCIRHGLSQHNLNYYKYGSQTFYDPQFVDTRLVLEGYAQAKELRETWNHLSTVELVIVSPLKRCLQTATELFRDTKIPMIALETVREYPMGLQTCNQRSTKESLQSQFPHIDFSDLQTNEDTLWNSEREETIDELNTRINVFKKYVLERPESTIAFVNHSSFICQMKDNSIKYLDNGDQELSHCYPYLFKL